MDAAGRGQPTDPAAEALDRPRAASSFLLDLGAALHAAAIPAPLVESRVREAARASGFHAEVFVLQGFLTVEIERGALARVDLRRISFETHWKLWRTHELGGLCAALTRGELDVRAGKAALERILAERSPYPRWMVVFDLLAGVPVGPAADQARFFDVFMTALQLVTGLLLAEVLRRFKSSTELKRTATS